MKVAIIGTGNIGSDLCARLLLKDVFEIVAFIGRRVDSPSLELFKSKVPTYAGGSKSLLDLMPEVDCVFDATSAHDHANLWNNFLKESGKVVIDLTPSRIGRPMVPILVGKVANFDFLNVKTPNYSMVTCGGQSSAPIIYSIAEHSSEIVDVEISSSIASKSAGPATRRNIDNYISSTEDLAGRITQSDNCKAILVLNPAEPPVMMRTTVQIRAKNFNLNNIQRELSHTVDRVQKYVPGYSIAITPFTLNDDVISATAIVKGEGHFLPEYAGNLDIINAAAIETATQHFYGKN